MKRYDGTHSLKHVSDDFIHEFLNSVSPFNHAILNLMKKIDNEQPFDDLLYSGQPFAVTSEKRKVIVKNVMEQPSTSSWNTGAAGRAFTYINILYTLFHSLP